MQKTWQKLRSGGTILGSFVSTPSTVSAEILGMAGFDFVMVDLEHGMSSERDLLPQVQTLDNTPALPTVRVESHDRVRVHRVLDLGMRGVMFPRVNTAGEAEACVAAMHYPPAGVRGVATMVRASAYGLQYPAYRDTTRETLLSIIQVETAEAVANVDSIAEVDGADVLFIGPMDLSTSMGIFRQYDHPDFVAALRKTVDAAERNGKAAGILLPAANETRKYRDLGFRCLMSSTDVTLLTGAAFDTSRTMRDQLGE